MNSFRLLVAIQLVPFSAHKLSCSNVSPLGAYSEENFDVFFLVGQWPENPSLQWFHFLTSQCLGPCSYLAAQAHFDKCSLSYRLFSSLALYRTSIFLSKPLLDFTFDLKCCRQFLLLTTIGYWKWLLLSTIHPQLPLHSVSIAPALWTCNRAQFVLIILVSCYIECLSSICSQYSFF